MKAKHAIRNNIESFVGYAMALAMTCKVQVEKPARDEETDEKPENLPEIQKIPKQKEIQPKPKRRCHKHTLL